MYSLDITVVDDARFWMTGIFVPGECPDLLRGAWGLEIGTGITCFVADCGIREQGDGICLDLLQGSRSGSD